MSPNSERAQQTRDWFRKASKDLRAADLLIQQPELHDLTAFHCQQAVEKALKGFLTWHEQPFRKTHDLLELIDQCVEIDPMFSSFRSFAGDISPYAIVVRYPDIEDEPEPGEVEAALRQTHAVLDFVRTRLPLEPVL